MLDVDRGQYAKANQYADSPQSIGYAVTISAPHMVRNSHLNLVTLFNQIGFRPHNLPSTLTQI
jgi:protein-L-isoaspartate O-methyltransferase